MLKPSLADEGFFYISITISLYTYRFIVLSCYSHPRFPRYFISTIASAYSILLTYLKYCVFHNKVSLRCMVNTVLCVNTLLILGMAIAYHSVPQASGSVCSTQRSLKLLIRKIPYLGVGYRRDNYIGIVLPNFQQPSISVGDSHDFSVNELRITLRKTCKTIISYYLIVREKIRL